jgi:glutamate dehydrogenase
LDLFGLHRIIGLASALDIADRYDRMALDRGLANLMRAQRDLTADVLAAEGDTVVERFSAWHVLHRAAVERTVRSVADLTEGELTVSRLTVAAGLLADLARGT